MSKIAEKLFFLIQKTVYCALLCYLYPHEFRRGPSGFGPWTSAFQFVSDVQTPRYADNTMIYAQVKLEDGWK